MKAIIYPGYGEKIGQYYFTLHGKNNRVIATGEHYTRKSNIIKTLKKCFPGFIIEDYTKL